MHRRRQWDTLCQMGLHVHRLRLAPCKQDTGTILRQPMTLLRQFDQQQLVHMRMYQADHPRGQRQRWHNLDGQQTWRHCRCGE